MKTNFISKQETLVVAIPPQSIIVPYLFRLLVTTIIFLFTFIKMSTAQCATAPTLTFNSPKLIAGTDNQIGAVYLFPEVITGVDAHVEIIDIVGGAELMDIDNTTGSGYYDAFQPYVLSGANGTSYLDWKITFKVAGSNTDTILDCLAVTAIDVDGNNKNLFEFVEAATPGSFAVDPFTNLTISFDGIRSKAEGQIATIPLIDTNQRQAMFQMNFTNINSLLYRNGAVSTGDTMTRQTCIYFKPFFSNWIVLPVKLLAFSAKEQTSGVVLNWSATNEQDMKSYTVQKSIDSKIWKDVETVVAGINLTNNYNMVDHDKNNVVTYYRLQQNSTKGTRSYSKIIMIGSTSSIKNLFTHNTVFNNGINLNIRGEESKNIIVELFTLNGNKILQQQALIHSGNNSLLVTTPTTITSGIYLLSIKDNLGKQVYQSKIIKG
ncbi:MAG: T9SS type A sorting domain-containing protein [Chitinophagaceae bacterium]